MEAPDLGGCKCEVAPLGSGNPAILENPTDRRLCVAALRQVCPEQ